MLALGSLNYRLRLNSLGPSASINTDVSLIPASLLVVLIHLFTVCIHTVFGLAEQAWAESTPPCRTPPCPWVAATVIHLGHKVPRHVGRTERVAKIYQLV